jgi:GntR family transcriptional regulator
MWFKIDYHSPTPVYEQIKERIKENILSNNLKEGDFLPSIRGLAQDIKVNLNTVSRAYRELEFESYITAQKGVGYIINKTNSDIIEDEILEDFKKIINRVFRSNISKNKVIKIIDEVYDGGE